MTSWRRRPFPPSAAALRPARLPSAPVRLALYTVIHWPSRAVPYEAVKAFRVQPLAQFLSRFTLRLVLVLIVGGRDPVRAKCLVYTGQLSVAAWASVFQRRDRGANHVGCQRHDVTIQVRRSCFSTNAVSTCSTVVARTSRLQKRTKQTQGWALPPPPPRGPRMSRCSLRSPLV